jgi:hypothetical protein
MDVAENVLHIGDALQDQFLPWHRHYIAQFEKALLSFQTGTIKVGLPYWDSSLPFNTTTWLPDLLTNITYTVGSGMNQATKPNYLSNANVKIPAIATCNPEARAVRRFPTQSLLPADLASLIANITFAYSQSSFGSFNNTFNNTGFNNLTITNLHSLPHREAGGTGTDVISGIPQGVQGDLRLAAFTAYDPIFWLHHANVDRIWSNWQNSANGKNPSGSLPSQVLNCFNDTTVLNTIHHKVNQYKYAYESPPIKIKKIKPVWGLVSSSGNYTIDIPKNLVNRLPKSNSIEIYLEIQAVVKKMQSLQIEVFSASVSSTTPPTVGGNVYLGKIALFTGVENMAHSSISDAPYTSVVDITEVIRNLPPNHSLRITVSPTDAIGKLISPMDLFIKGARFYRVS